MLRETIGEIMKNKTYITRKSIRRLDSRSFKRPKTREKTSVKLRLCLIKKEKKRKAKERKKNSQHD